MSANQAFAVVSGNSSSNPFIEITLGASHGFEVQAFYVVVDHNSEVVQVGGNDTPAPATALVTYGSNQESIRSALTAAIRDACGDVDLRVTFIGV